MHKPSTPILPLLACLLLMIGCGRTYEYEYWDGMFPPTVNAKVFPQVEAELNRAKATGHRVQHAQILYDQTVNMYKDRARNQGWEEFEQGRWRRVKSGE